MSTMSGLVCFGIVVHFLLHSGRGGEAYADNADKAGIGGVGQMLTSADKREGGVWQMLTLAEKWGRGF